MKDFHELAAWIGEVNNANGFERPTWDKLPTKLMLVATELNEARDAVRGTGPDPLPEELADTIVRLLDILGALWPGEWSTSRVTETPYVVQGNPLFRSIEELLWAPLNHVCVAAEKWRYNDRDDTRIAIELALRDTWALGEALSFDMHEQVQRKVEHNAQRGLLHGKKRADG